MKKIMLLGSGELGKEFVIAIKRLGQYVIAVDSYNDAPAQQVADEREVINMLDGAELDRMVAKHKPDIIVPEMTDSLKNLGNSKANIGKPLKISFKVKNINGFDYQAIETISY